ncbi:unnamed protein product, partial [Closterium sp. NIES-65]
LGGEWQWFSCNKALSVLEKLPFCSHRTSSTLFPCFPHARHTSQAWAMSLGDEWRWFSYYKALSVLEKLPFRIRSAQQVQGLPSIGSSLQGKIQEILSYSMIKKLRAYQADDMVRTLALFGTVWGVGPRTARRFYSAGHRSLRQLAGDPSLTPTQRIALRFHEDMNKRIPRDEVAAMAALVVKEGDALQPGVSAARGECCEGWVLPGISIVCGGSYRRGKATSGDMDFIITHPDGARECCRGKATSGDMDFIITHPDGASHCGLLERLVGGSTEARGLGCHCGFLEKSSSGLGDRGPSWSPPFPSPSDLIPLCPLHIALTCNRSHRGFLDRLVGRLKLVGFLTEDLMVGTHHSQQPHGEGKGVDTYFGLCKQAGREQRHRIDFKVYPWEQYPFGLIQWTGNDVLNRRMRLFAEAKGYRLDDHGLVLRNAVS